MATRNRLTKAEYEMLAAFRFALRQFLRFSEEEAQAAKLTPQQHQALLAIKGFPGRDTVNVSELAERLQLRHHSAVELIDRLEADKLVKREPDESDGRKVLIGLTGRGEQVLEKLSEAHREQLDRIGPQLTRLLNELTGEE
jgi:DNA-binding MarR family transcriptional regulator